MANPIYSTQSITSLTGYLNHAIDVLKQGSEVVLIGKYSSGDPLSATLKSGSIVNKTAIDRLNQLVPLSTSNQLSIREYRDQLRSIRIEVDQQLPFNPTAGHIMKSGEKIPFGYLAEIILQAAIVSRFTNRRTQTVSKSDVVDKLTEFVNGKSDNNVVAQLVDKVPKSNAVNKAFAYTVANRDQSIGNDTVYVYYSLNEPSFRWLSKKLPAINRDAQLDPFFNDAVQYVNQGGCRQHGDYFYNNGKVDRIDIVSLGIMGQGETKADIRTQYFEGWQGGKTGRPMQMNLNLSVKIRHVDQVGQLTGITSDKLSRLVEMFGLSLTKQEKDKIDSYSSMLVKNNKMILDKKYQGLIYQILYDKLATANDLGKILAGLEYFIALRESSTLSIVDIGSGLRVYFAKNLADIGQRYKNKNYKITSTVKTGGGMGVTKSIVYNIDGQPLLKVSSRFTGGVYRNFIETGSFLRSILAGDL